MRKRLIVLTAIFVFHLLICSVYSDDQESDLERINQISTELDQLVEEEKYAETIPLLNEMLTILERNIDPEDREVADILNLIADMYLITGQHAKAESIYPRVLAIRKKALGHNHPSIVKTLKDVAKINLKQKRYESAKSYYLQAFTILEDGPSRKNKDMPFFLHQIAYCYERLKGYDNAKLFYERSIEAYYEIYGPDHIKSVTTINNLAALYNYAGDYSNAELLYERALSIREKILSPEHYETAESRDNLAGLYKKMGKMGSADELSQKTTAIKKKAADESEQLRWKAMRLAQEGKFLEAIPVEQKSLNIAERVMGPKSIEVANELFLLSALYSETGNYSKAESLLKRELTIRRNSSNKYKNFTIAFNLHRLGELYHNVGDLSNAESFFKEELTIREKVGPESYLTVKCLNKLGTVIAEKGDYDLAFRDFIRAQRIATRNIRNSTGSISDEYMDSYLFSRKSAVDIFLTMIVSKMLNDKNAIQEIFDIWLGRKGIAFESQKMYQEAMVYSDDPEVKTIFQELTHVRSLLSKLAFSGSVGDSHETIRKLESKKEDLEVDLSILSDSWALNRKIKNVDSKTLARTLPENSVLVEFLRYDLYSFKAKGNGERWLPPSYIAFILHAGDGSKLDMVNLGDVKTIDDFVGLFKDELDELKGNKPLETTKTSRKLHDLVFMPLKKALGEVTEVYISPDGDLNLIPFEVLQGPDGRYLIEDYTFNYIAAGRDILGFGEIKETGAKPLIMGNPDFDMGSSERDSSLKRLALVGIENTEAMKRSPDMGGLYFPPLPGTKLEADQVNALLGKNESEIYTGKAALEEVLMNKGAPRILHLATHGFFLGDQNLSVLVDESDRGITVSPLSISHKGTGKVVKIGNPLLRSGIALAGANNALRMDDEESSDGIVTAEKILGLRLRGTEMVVLSACETGLGEVKAGEGVYGLRRAFTQAGAKSLVMSMWSVPDKETQELMIEFYKNITSGKMNRCQSLRQAALKQKEIVKERYGTANPLYWGAFVFMGEP